MILYMVDFTLWNTRQQCVVPQPVVSSFTLCACLPDALFSLGPTAYSYKEAEYDFNFLFEKSDIFLECLRKYLHSS